MRALLVLALLVSGCVSESQIGPYVRNVQRNGSFLVVTKCMILLEGDDLNEGQCTMEQVPLGSVPMMQPQQQPPMQQPPMQPPQRK